MRTSIGSAALVVVLGAGPAPAQTPIGGNVSFTFDHLPNTPALAAPDNAGATELRIRLFADRTLKRGVLTVRAAGYAEGLLADRGLDAASSTAIVRAQELYAELSGTRVDLRVGWSRIVWGRLDELQPGDVINPLDLSKFFFEGRSEARLPVLVARGRWHVREGATLEGVLVPRFQAGHFDQLDEASSPFNLVPRTIAVRVEEAEPEAAVRNLQGGVRLSATSGRVDWAVAAFRGFEAFPVFHLELNPMAGGIVPTLVGSHPRTSMIAGDFESVLGEWGIRGEAVAFDAIGGRSAKAGVGVDRRSGAYRFSTSVLVDHAKETNLSLIGSAERTFDRETRLLRGLGLYNVSKGTAFLRVIGAVSVRDNLWLEGSAGLFVGEGDDVVGLFRDRDFLYARLRYYF